jgi:hypothetical protein
LISKEAPFGVSVFLAGVIHFTSRWLHVMKFIGSAAVALIVLWFADQLFNDARFTRVAHVVLRQALASIGINV